jgi:D-alanine--D-alanine ligase
MKKLSHLALFCGGPSLERGISLNSARSVYDHLQPLLENISIFYVSPAKIYYKLEPGQLYSNTPMDFDFKLGSFSEPISEKELLTQLKEVDIVFPVIHGAFGEDGGLQSLLESNDIPFVGPGSQACFHMYHKPQAKKFLERNGFKSLPYLEISQNTQDIFQKVKTFFQSHRLKRAIVKPAAGGSSIGISSVETFEQAFEKVQYIFNSHICDQVLVEPFCVGKEFTLIVLESQSGKPVALVPSEIQICYKDHKIFDYRRKYLPTTNTHWLCPPSFSETVIQEIQTQGEALFNIFGLRDFTRMDGWLLESGEIIFTDFNPISGIEQNSFIFQQAAWMGLSHQDLLQYILSRACERYGLSLVPSKPEHDTVKKAVAVVFGGRSAERQVSLMSGTNVWLKLRHSKKITPNPYFIDLKGTVWHLPYPYALSHTVEEITERCQTASKQEDKLSPFRKNIRERLGLPPLTLNLPEPFSLEAFCHHAQQNYEFIFIGLHGGIGEDGTLQKKFDDHGLFYNGSGPQASAICMDKKWTADLINESLSPGVQALPKLLFDKEKTAQEIWQQAAAFPEKFDKFIIKPRSDGCSAGIVLLEKQEDLSLYLSFLKEGADYIPANQFAGQYEEIELSKASSDLMMEPYIETDRVQITNHKLHLERKTGWLELTVGVLEHGGNYHSLNPSITVASHAILSLEEKFQGGTGVNLTPPPSDFIPSERLQSIKIRLAEVAKLIGIKTYCRIDVFYHPQEDKLIVIEVNSLPALTPSTVIYHQALAEPRPLAPRAFLEKLIEQSGH